MEKNEKTKGYGCETGTFSPDVCHEKIFERKPLLSYEVAGQNADYKQRLKEKLTDLLGDMPEKTDPKIRIVSEEDMGNYILKRIEFYSEEDALVPGWLMLPKNVKKPPVVICLQGHSTGMHLSLGVAKFEIDEMKIKSGDRDFGRIAVANGYAAFILEQRCFGERQGTRVPNYDNRCHFTACNALLLGRTLIGERIWDVSRAIDVCETLSDVDGSKIAVMGNSGGGTVTYYAACMDERIQIAMPSCSVCTYKDSIGSMYHCTCNYIPRAQKYFDMGDLGALIAPRKLVVVAGNQDPIFPLAGVKEAYEIIQKEYDDVGAKDNCTLYIGEGAHRFYRDAYEYFDKYAKELGWKK